MALDRLTKIDGVGISTTSDYRVGVITATKFVGPVEGSITASSANFSGNVTIGGTLTYEDVTNIDSVGIITAAKDIHVGAGISAVGVITGRYLNPSSVSTQNVIIGWEQSTRNVTGTWNVLLGRRAGEGLTSGGSAVCIGANAGQLLGSSSGIFIGGQAGSKATGGGGNVFIGMNAGQQTTSAGACTIIGTFAGIDNQGSNNTLVGNYAGRGTSGNTDGAQNTFIGAGSGFKIQGGDDNTGVGYYSLRELLGGNKNVAIGRNAGDALVSGNNNIIIGYNADASTSSISNEITLGDANINHLRIPGIGVSFNSTGGTQLGIITATGIVLGDGSDGNASLNRLKFGASEDLQIYHNQYHSKIVDQGTGALIISGSEVRFETEPSSTETLRITSAGYVGINENSPIHQLSVGINTSTAWDSTKNISNTTNNDFIGLNIDNNNSGSNPEVGIMLQAGASGIGQYTINCRKSGTNTADLIFRTRDGGGASKEVLRIDSSGNVGIGTNVVSDSSGNARAFTIARSDANGQVRLVLKNIATGFGNGAGYHQGIDGANVFIENRTNGGYIDFATFDSGGSYGSRLRITSTEIDAQVPITGAVPAPNRNLIENGEFLISQRFGNASSTKANSGTNIVNGVENGVIDRWRMSSPGASNIARQRVTDAPDGFAYSFKVSNDSSVFSPSNSNYTFFQQIIEAPNVARLAFGTSSAKTVTLSFYVKSSYASTWAVALGNTTGGVYVGNTTRTHIKSYTTNSANTWERKTITFPGDTSGTWANTGTGGGLSVIWDLGSGGNHQGTSQNTWASSDDFRFSGAKNVADAANGSWQITGIQLEIGSTATEYEHLPFQYELQRCQRYFYCGNTLGSGSWNSPSTFHVAVHHPVAMRARVTQGLTRSGVLSNINIEPRDQYDITVFDPDAHTHYAPPDINSVQVMNFQISGSTTTGYSGTVSIDRNDDQFWVSAEL